MGTPGKTVVIPGGKRGVLTGGKSAVFNSAGACAKCCAPPPCYTLTDCRSSGGMAPIYSTSSWLAVPAGLGHVVKIVGSPVCWVPTIGCPSGAALIAVTQVGSDYTDCDSCLCCYCDAACRFSQLSSVVVDMWQWLCVSDNTDCSNSTLVSWLEHYTGSFPFSVCSNTTEIIYAGTLTQRDYSALGTDCPTLTPDVLQATNTYAMSIKYDCGTGKWYSQSSTFYGDSVWHEGLNVSITGYYSHSCTACTITPFCDSTPTYNVFRAGSGAMTVTGNSGCDAGVPI